jgi:deoxyribonuclease V
MKIQQLHDWDLTTEQAIELQRKLASQVRILDTAQQRSANNNSLKNCKYIAGADASYGKNADTIHSIVVVMNASDMTVVETQHATAPLSFPYVPGLLSFREAPVLLKAFEMVQTPIDLVMFDGAGFAHPRRFGIACHVGLWLDLPCIGVAKSRLCGHYEEPGEKRGQRSPLKVGDEVIGTVLRTKDKTNPLYVSPGHLISFEDAVHWVLECGRGYRISEPTRQADILVEAARRAG